MTAYAAGKYSEALREFRTYRRITGDDAHLPEMVDAERALGREPVEMPRNNPGYDIRSTDQSGFVHYIEVKGRIEGSDTFTITTNEITFAQTQGDRHRLALVEVSTSGADSDQLRYVSDAFTHLEPSATTRSYNEVWRDYWERGGPPR